MTPSGEILIRVVLDPQGQVPEGSVTYGVAAGEGSVRYDSLRDFYHDLILGRPLPTSLVADGVKDVSMVVLTALFLHRDLALQASTPGLVANAELACWGSGGLAHMTSGLAAWFRFLHNYIVTPKLSVSEQGRRLKQAVAWVRDYILLGDLPTINWEPASPAVLDLGTTGFVVATQPQTDLESGWVELYRQGYLRGILWGLSGSCLIARKSPYIPFDLTAAYCALMGLQGAWVLDQANGFLWGSGVTDRDAIMQILVRV